MKKPSPKILIAAIAFLLIWAAAATVAPGIEVSAVLGILLLTVFLFAFEVVGVDVAAVSIMVLLGLISHFGGLLGFSRPLVPASELFRGFSGNAVISIIAVMIIGAGLDKTGLMGKLAVTILKVRRPHRGARHSGHLRHGRLHLQLHAERRRCRAVPAGGEPHLGAHRPGRCRAC
jgi:di/tricarboxylate transporter